jgi:glucosamine--fructose-6-phosphate aminotransferase (isomerizing)
VGIAFEREIREQPAVWERVAASGAARRLADAIDGPVVLVGSGSSLFAAQLGALALRRRRIDAVALAATEAHLDHRAYEGHTVVALSQSGRSTDLLQALDVLGPRRTVALTNSAASPLASRADVTIDILAGPEVAVPASKSVTATVALLLWAASLKGGSTARDAPVLREAASQARAWLASPACDAVAGAAREIVRREHVAVLGSDYGLPIAREAALKLKEAAYLHAEGFSAGEFRHGSVAMVDETYAVIGIVDHDALGAVERPLRDVGGRGALRYLVGSCDVDGIERLGPDVVEPYNTLGWLVTAQLLSLYAARAKGIDPDAPRGLTKAIVER